MADLEPNLLASLVDSSFQSGQHTKRLVKNGITSLNISESRHSSPLRVYQGLNPNSKSSSSGDNHCNKIKCKSTNSTTKGRKSGYVGENMDSMRQINVRIPAQSNKCYRSIPVMIASIVFCAVLFNHPSATVAAKCEPINVELCRDMPWNLTYMPNLVHHSSQRNAALVLSQFSPLLKMRCSRYLRFFLCSMFTPMCFQTERYPKVIPPCRKICVDARDKCEPIMLKHNVTWPEQLSCDVLPEYHRGMCIEPEAFVGREEESQPSCSATNPVKCSSCKKYRVKNKNVFKANKYDFVFRARIEKVTKLPCSADVRVNITMVYKYHTIELRPGPNLLMLNGSCVCPRLKKGKREFVLGGHENMKTGELFLHKHSMAEKWSKRWDKKLLKWLKRFKKASLNRRRRTDGSTGPPQNGGSSEKPTERGKRKRKGKKSTK